MTEDERMLHEDGRIVADQMMKVFGVSARAYVVDEEDGSPAYGQVALTLEDARRVLQCRANLEEETSGQR